MLSLHCLTLVIVETFLLGTQAAAPPELTQADIPSGLSVHLKQLIEKTFSNKVTFAPDAFEREMAAKEIGEMHERAAAAVPFLIRLLGDGEYSVQSTARTALVAIGEPAVEPCILVAKTPVVVKKTSCGLYPQDRRCSAISCLGKLQFKFPTAFNALLELLEDKNPEVRISAVRSLDGCTDKRATLPLLKALKDFNNEVRRGAADCFITLHDERAVKPLLEMVEKQHCPTAITALGYQKDRRALPVLLQIIQNPSEGKHTRGDAAKALGRIGDMSAFTALQKVFWNSDEPPETRSGTIYALAMFRNQKHVGDMLWNLYIDESTSFELKIDIVKAVAEYGDPQEVKRLLHVVEDHGKNKLAFWAAMSAVQLSDGAIDDLGVVRVIQAYKEYEEGVERDVIEKKKALQRIAEQGTTWRVRFAANNTSTLWIEVPVTIIGVLIVFTAFWIIRSRVRRRASASQICDSSGSGDDPIDVMANRTEGG